MRKVFKLIKQILRIGSEASDQKTPTPCIIPREKHSLSRSKISNAALKVLYRLHRSGYCAYLVGGSVRDILLGCSPKDFDVVTNAHPEEIKALFRNSFIIGRRFKLVHVRFGHEIIEVATFRGSIPHSGRVQTHQGLLLRDNVYGSLDDDVWRRDFTVNALYYNIEDFSVVDYTQGMSDLSRRLIRVIGDPQERYREDPARMLRALRLAAKLNFAIEEETSRQIKENKHLLTHVPPARVFDKMLKIFHSGTSLQTIQLWQEYDVFSILFPLAAKCLEDPAQSLFIETALKNADQRMQAHKAVNSAFLFAVILWIPLQLIKERILSTENLNEYQALHAAMGEALQFQIKIMSIPRRFTTVIREIWQQQYHLEHAKAKRIFKVFYHPRFRAAYDFLLLRSETHEPMLKTVAEWWTAFIEADEEDRSKLIATRFGKGKGKTRRRRKPRSNNDPSVSSNR